MITIINDGMGNTQSVVNAFKFIGSDVEVVDSPEKLKSADKIVLPGVGAFGEGMKKLRVSGFDKALEDAVINKGVPFLGICLGMQLLAAVGLENGSHEGLGWIDGTVKKFDFPSNLLCVPHVGWNNLVIEGTSALFHSCDRSPDYYFVHSYHFHPESVEVVTSWCDYGIRFASSVQKNNIFGVQFHPEKSHKEGLNLLERFVEFKEIKRVNFTRSEQLC